MIALACALAAMALPLALSTVLGPVDPDADPLDPVPSVTTLLGWLDRPLSLVLAGVVLAAACAGLVLHGRPRLQALALAPGAAAGAALPLALLAAGLGLQGGAWLIMLAALAMIVTMLLKLSAIPGVARDVVVPALFGLTLLYLWEVLVRGFAVPLILLPPPSLVAATLLGAAPVLAGDFVQTVLRSALRGYVIGCATGFGLALLCDRFAWLRAGLLPYANMLSAVPMVGVAPIAIMWFGFDWPSKAAVVVVATIFPMLVNTLVGLEQADRIELDVMRSYAAGYRRTLLSLRLPKALPFIFTALKVNSTFALISAIVAEFFGTPIAGMGFRISTEVARMDLGMVWATITVAALTGSFAYGALALVERAATRWHPSTREP